MKDLNIIYTKIDDLRPSAYNPRKWDEDSIAHLTKSIKRFGLVDPIIVDATGTNMQILILR